MGKDENIAFQIIVDHATFPQRLNLHAIFLERAKAIIRESQ